MGLSFPCYAPFPSPSPSSSLSQLPSVRCLLPDRPLFRKGAALIPDESTRTLTLTQTLYDQYDSLLQTSSKLVKAIERADWYDRLLIFSAFLFFLLCVGWVLKRRVLDRVAWGVGWWFGGSFRLIRMFLGGGNAAAVVGSGAGAVVGSGAGAGAGAAVGAAKGKVAVKESAGVMLDTPPPIPPADPTAGLGEGIVPDDPSSSADSAVSPQQPVRVNHHEL